MPRTCSMGNPACICHRALRRAAEVNLPVRRTSSPSHGATRRTGSPSYKLRMVSSILPLALVVKPAKQPCCREVLECLHPAEKWMRGALAHTVHVFIELSITVGSGSAGGQTGIMGCTCRPEIHSVISLPNESVSTEGVARATRTPTWTAARTVGKSRCGECSCGKEDHQQRESSRFHVMASLNRIPE